MTRTALNNLFAKIDTVLKALAEKQDRCRLKTWLYPLRVGVHELLKNLNGLTVAVGREMAHTVFHAVARGFPLLRMPNFPQGVFGESSGRFIFTA